jgi:hypothetical protein
LTLGFTASFRDMMLILFLMLLLFASNAEAQYTVTVNTNGRIVAPITPAQFAAANGLGGGTNGGVQVAAGNNITTTTNGNVVTVNSTASGSALWFDPLLFYTNTQSQISSTTIATNGEVPLITQGAGVTIGQNIVNGRTNYTFNIAGSAAGSTFIPVTAGTQVYSSAGFTNMNAATAGLQEGTGDAWDGTNWYHAYNPNYIEGRYGSPNGPLIASNYSPFSTSSYNVSCGLYYTNNLLYWCVTMWTNGTENASSNAVIVLSVSNLVVQSVHPLGQQPLTIQHFVPMDATHAVACYFGSPETGTSVYPAGKALLFYTIGSYTTGTAWNVASTLILNQYLDMEGLAFDNTGTLYSMGQATYPNTNAFLVEDPSSTTFEQLLGSPLQVNIINLSSGAMNSIAWCWPTNSEIVNNGHIQGSCMFVSNNYSQIGIVMQGATENTNYFVQFSLAAGTNYIQATGSGLLSAPTMIATYLFATAGDLLSMNWLQALYLTAKNGLYCNTMWNTNGIILLPNTTGPGAANQTWIVNQSGLLWENVPTGDYFEWFVNNIAVFSISGALVNAVIPINDNYGFTNTSAGAGIGPTGVITGSGGGITGLNASQLSSGTVPYAALPGNLGPLSTNNAAALTNLNASALASGFVPLVVLTNIVYYVTNGAANGQYFGWNGGINWSVPPEATLTSSNSSVTILRSTSPGGYTNWDLAATGVVPAQLVTNSGVLPITNIVGGVTNIQNLTGTNWLISVNTTNFWTTNSSGCESNGVWVFAMTNGYLYGNGSQLTGVSGTGVALQGGQASNTILYLPTLTNPVVSGTIGQNITPPGNGQVFYTGPTNAVSSNYGYMSWVSSNLITSSTGSYCIASNPLPYIPSAGTNVIYIIHWKSIACSSGSTFVFGANEGGPNGVWNTLVVTNNGTTCFTSYSNTCTMSGFHVAVAWAEYANTTGISIYMTPQYGTTTLWETIGDIEWMHNP